MNGLNNYLQEWRNAWNKFWFVERGTFVLAIIRISLGMLLLYNQLIWMIASADFLGPDGVIPAGHRELFFGNSFAWSHLDWLTSDSGLMIAHVVGLIIILLFTLGWMTRVTAVLTCLLVISYANRATGALFGLDQICGFLAIYLAIGNCGGSLSIDRWLALRKPLPVAVPNESVWNNIAIRLMQIHMCVVYLFAGCGKLQGETWWNGEAIWGALASFEYQTMDFTWLAEYMWLVNLITLVTLVWEVGYAFLIWPRMSRPIMLCIAFFVHLGIGLAMGMLTFGFVMIIGNFAFAEEHWFARWNSDRSESGD